jgi:hypothetical protein
MSLYPCQEEYKDQTSLVSRLKVVVTSMQQARRPTDARTPTAGGALTPSTSSLSLPAHAVTTPTNGATGGVETIRASPPAVSIPSSALAPPNGGVQNGSMAQHWGSSVPNTVGTAFSPVQPPPALPNMPQRPVSPVFRFFLHRQRVIALFVCVSVHGSSCDAHSTAASTCPVRKCDGEYGGVEPTTRSLGAS